jgi:hypothetical protein
MVWTKCSIFFTRESERSTVDTIPLHEVLSISSASENEPRKSFSMMSFSQAIERKSDHPDAERPERRDNATNGLGSGLRDVGGFKVEKIFQIRTIAEGFNSGRTYSLETESVTLRRSIVSKLEVCVSECKQRVGAKSKFQELQTQVRNVYRSTPFQGTVAILIILVREVCKFRKGNQEFNQVQENNMNYIIVRTSSQNNPV